MNFFEHQDRARASTTYLLVLFGLTVLGVFIAVYCLFLVLGVLSLPEEYADRFWDPDVLWRPSLLLGVGGFLTLIIGGGWMIRTISLREGGVAVAESIGADEVSGSRDRLSEDEHRALNIIEEMSLASGIPIPRLFILHGQRGINAFAAGYSPKDAAVILTEGAIARLRRDELQGVIAHEFSHILNNDIAINQQLLGMLAGLCGITECGRLLLRFCAFTSEDGCRSSRRSKLPALLLGAGLWIIGALGVFFARLLQRAVSRQREYLADASAVQFTRNPSGIADALKCIGALPPGAGYLNIDNREELAHMLFTDDNASIGLFDLMASHPPLDDRIKRIDPMFAGDYTPFKRPMAAATPRENAPHAAMKTAPTFPLPIAMMPLGRQTETTLPLNLPPAVRPMIDDPANAVAGIFALSLAHDLVLHGRIVPLLDIVRGAFSDAMAEQARRFAVALVPLSRGERRQIAELLVAPLHRLPLATRRRIAEAVTAMTRADDAISLPEYMLQRLVCSRLSSDPVSDAGEVPSRLQASRAALVVLTTLANFGNPYDPVKAAAALEAGRQSALNLSQVPPPAPEACSLEGIDQALTLLARADAETRNNLLSSCASVVTFDSRVTDDEAELLRAIAGALDLPTTKIKC